MTKPESDVELNRLPGLGLLWGGIGCVGFVLTAFLVVGVLLPGTWTAERERLIPVPPSELYSHVGDLDRWEAWTHWPELKSVQDSLEGGLQVGRSWDDPNYGRGTLTLVGREPGRSVTYEVRVEGGIQIDGTIVLEAAATGTRLRWTENGTFSRNPLLRYTALSMDELQGEEMDKALDRLSEVATTR